MHERKLARCRELISFMEAKAGKETPDFRALAKLALAAGLFKPGKEYGALSVQLSNLWAHRKYWQSDRALSRYQNGQPIPRP